ncbi:hypothetical protein TrVE_jg3004 [Triparma verrucosa]|uniref:Uncharacterized protein n=1 Tax=Triparma verrucosa TaxID=1606542 RepID=A0A9W7FJJ7_9STRA|nr:hypothetical protein TrVE_jg3004 [Triparma verrucosa]
MQGLNTKATNSSAGTAPVRDSTTRLKSLLSYLDSAETSLLPPSSHASLAHDRTDEEVVGRSYSNGNENDYDDDDDLPPNPPLDVRSSVSADRKWIWDSYNDDGTESVAPSSVMERSQVQAPQSTISSYSTMNTGKFKDIKAKIKQMKIELTSKSEDSKTLKASLMRRKVGDERVCRQIEEGWVDRLSKRKREFEDMIERQDSFSTQLKKSIDLLGERIKSLDGELTYKDNNFVNAVDVAKAEVKEELKEKREEWLKGEKVRLNRLAEAKEKDLKKEAVKALEPELVHLINGNKNDLEERRKEIEVRLKSFKDEKLREGKLLLNEERVKREKEAEASAEEIRKGQSKSLMELANGQEEDLQMARMNWKREIEAERSGFENERRRRVAEYAAEMEEARRAGEERFSKLANEHEEEIQSMMAKRSDAVVEKKDNLDSETSIWQRRQLEQIRASFNAQEKEAFASLRDQSTAELDMVIAKLEAQAKQERMEICSAVEKTLQPYKSSLQTSEVKATEEEQLIMDRYAIDHEKAQLLQEEVALLESRVVGMERRVAITEDNLKSETSKYIDARSSAASKLGSLKKGQGRGVELAEIEIESLKKQLQDLDVTVSDFGPVNEKEISRIEIRCGKELESVEGRVRLVLMRKDEVKGSLEKEGGSLENRANLLSKELDERRREDIVKGVDGGGGGGGLSF